MKTNNNIPAYRFQGYTDAWELRKIFEIADRFNNLRVPIASSLRIPGSTPYYGANGIQDYVEGYTHNGEFVLIAEDGANDLKNYPVNLVNGKIWVNNHAHVLQGKENITNNKFLAYSINRANIEALLVGGGRAKLNSDVLMNIKLEIPSLKEQSAIGTFFSTLDRHITLHQRKLDTLKEQKKTYLKLLFPAKGQTKPALRFQGFEDDWKEVKLGEVLVEYNKKSEIENQFELLSSTNSGIEPRSGRVSGESNIGYKIIKRGMVVLSPQNLWLGNINYNAKFEIGIVSPSYKVFNINGPNELYLATVLRLPKMFFEYAQASVQGASIVRRNLDLDLFGSILVPLPTLSEQEAIGTFFQTLDQELAQVEDKLASLKEMKKTLLRKLFV
ncbi:TPA: restriction endonuclease subunit S [Streptococcus suis]|nr:restriction endonuclease subunit S [Streptococcus suis]